MSNRERSWIGGYLRILDRHKYDPPMAEQALVEKAFQRMASALPEQNHRDLFKELRIRGWSGPGNGSRSTPSFNQTGSACQRSRLGCNDSCRMGGHAVEPLGGLPFCGPASVTRLPGSGAAANRSVGSEGGLTPGCCRTPECWVYPVKAV